MLDAKKFVAALKDKPKASAKLWYSPNDSEAFMFARQIYRWLGAGVSGDGAGWNVDEPVSVPQEGGLISQLEKAPPAMRYGAWYGLAVLTGDPELDAGAMLVWDGKTAISALSVALLDSGIGHSSVSHPSIPKGTLILVVGQKQ